MITGSKEEDSEKVLCSARLCAKKPNVMTSHVSFKFEHSNLVVSNINVKRSFRSSFFGNPARLPRGCISTPLCLAIASMLQSVVE
jgi:hypothetical protein